MESVRSQLYGLYGLGKGEKIPDVDQSYHLPPFDMDNDTDEPIYALP